MRARVLDNNVNSMAFNRNTRLLDDSSYIHYSSEPNSMNLPFLSALRTDLHRVWFG